MTAALDALHLHETRLDRAEIIQCVELGVRFSLLQLAIVDHLAQVAPLLAILRDLDLELIRSGFPVNVDLVDVHDLAQVDAIPCLIDIAVIGAGAGSPARRHVAIHSGIFKTSGSPLIG